MGLQETKSDVKGAFLSEITRTLRPNAILA